MRRLGINEMDETHEESNRGRISAVESVRIAPGIQVSTLGENLGRWGR
jgi:hypothetical protein